MNELKDIELDLNNRKDENKHMISIVYGDYTPLQKNMKLLKYILYTSKLEIKINSLFKLIYSTSLIEIFLWIVGFLLFMESPSNLYLIWVLIIHIAKGILGLSILNKIPKTYEIIESLLKNPNFQENKILDLITTHIREIFLIRWNNNKRILLIYMISAIISFIIDIIIFIIQVSIFGNRDKFIMESILLTITFILICIFILFRY